jgi:hypothetical protein
MSTARDRFGVSILVALVLGVLLSAAPEAASASAPHSAGIFGGAAGDEGFGSIDNLAAATSARTQLAVALGAGVPLVIIGCMVRRRLYAEV